VVYPSFDELRLKNVKNVVYPSSDELRLIKIYLEGNLKEDRMIFSFHCALM
jgi:hypothetical protein